MKGISTVNKNIVDVNIRFDNLLSNYVSRHIKDLIYEGSKLITIKGTRLDMLSLELYDTTEYDWILALYNGLKSTNLTIGITLRYPTKESIQNILVK